MLMWGASKMQQLFYVRGQIACCCSWHVVQDCMRCGRRSLLTDKPAARLAIVQERAACLALPTHFARYRVSPLQFFRWAIYLYGLVVLLQVVIHMASPDYRWATFPNE